MLGGSQRRRLAAAVAHRTHLERRTHLEAPLRRKAGFAPGGAHRAAGAVAARLMRAPRPSGSPSRMI